MRLIDADKLHPDRLTKTGELAISQSQIAEAQTVEITEEQAIDKLHKTGWLPRHDKEMTERPKGEWKRGRIEYKRCKCFDDGYGGILYHEVINGKDVRCCLGATNEPTEWADICEECFECPKYIENILKEAENE